MFMRYRGGGVGHGSTREATNKFLHDRDRLDVPNGHEGVEDDLEEDEMSGLNEGGEQRPQCSGGEDDMDGADCISGGDRADGTTGDGFGSDEEDDYGYDNGMDDDDENPEPELDDADDALGPEDGEGEGDEMYLLGFATL